MGDFDFSEPEEDAAWAKAAEYTRGLFLRSANHEEEIARCEELRRHGNEHDREIFTRIIERLRQEFAPTSEKIPLPESPWFDEVYALAVNVLGDESKAALWLCEPSSKPGGRSPLQMLQTEDGAKEVKDTPQATRDHNE